MDTAASNRLAACNELRQRRYERASFIAHAAIDSDSLIICLCVPRNVGWIVKSAMDDEYVRWIYRARFAGIVTYRDYAIEMDIRQFVDVLWPMVANIDACLGHHSHRIGVEPTWFHSCRIRNQQIAV